MFVNHQERMTDSLYWNKKELSKSSKMVRQFESPMLTCVTGFIILSRLGMNADYLDWPFMLIIKIMVLSISIILIKMTILSFLASGLQMIQID